MRIAIGSDHAALTLKTELMDHLDKRGIQYDDLDTFTEELVDYPICGEKVARVVAAREYDLGLLICGTGVGMSLAANKVRGVRAVVCTEPYSARLAKEHNDANILCLGARVIGSEMAKMIFDAWYDAVFEGGRHAHRLSLIADIEEGSALR